MFKAMSVVVAAGAASAAMGGTMTTDFSGFSNGANVEGTTFNMGTAAEFVATSVGNNLGLYIFDTTPGGPNDGGVDQDLIVPGFGNALILQDNTGPIPNDSSEGGTINFAFTNDVELVSVTLIDIDAGAAVTLSLTDAQGDTRVFSVPNNWTGEPGPGVDGFGVLDFATNNQAGESGSATFVDTGMFDLDMVSTMAVFFSGSAALDNLIIDTPIVPLPASALLGLAGLGLVGGVRRRSC